MTNRISELTTGDVIQHRNGHVRYRVVGFTGGWVTLERVVPTTDERIQRTLGQIVTNWRMMKLS